MKSVPIAAASSFLSAGGHAATISNGSMTGIVDFSLVPAGWSILSTSPDTNDETTYFCRRGSSPPDSFTASPPGPAPDRGTYAGLGRTPINTGSRAFNEVFGQLVGDFDIDASFELSWYAGNWPQWL